MNPKKKDIEELNRVLTKTYEGMMYVIEDSSYFFMGFTACGNDEWSTDICDAKMYTSRKDAEDAIYHLKVRDNTTADIRIVKVYLTAEV